MQTENSVKSAIARSISHTEIVAVEVDDMQSALEEVENACADPSYFDSTEVNGATEAWGVTENCEDFRLRLIEASK